MPAEAINGVALYWELIGQGGDPIVLVHGSWGDHHSWDGIAPGLARSFRVLTYDRRGHSQSERPGGKGSVREDVADLACLIERLDLAPAHILGNSFGGSVALRLAAQRPDFFRSLLVHEPPLFGLLEEAGSHDALRAFQERVQVVIGLLENAKMEAGARQLAETIAFGPGAWEQLPDGLKQGIIFNAPTFLDEQRDSDWLMIDLHALENFASPALLTRETQANRASRWCWTRSPKRFRGQKDERFAGLAMYRN